MHIVFPTIEVDETKSLIFHAYLRPQLQLSVLFTGFNQHILSTFFFPGVVVVFQSRISRLLPIKCSFIGESGGVDAGDG